MITGFILAGGRSSRMGRDKALLPTGSRTLIEHVIQRVRPHVQRLVVIGHAQNVAHLQGLPVDHVLTDLKPDCGPLMGIYTGLLHAEAPLNLFVPCDMPWINGRLVEQLLRAWHESVAVIASLVPGEGLQPFPLICHVKACRIIGALLDRGERSIHALVHQPETRLVTVQDPDLWRAFRNINTPTDYAELCEETALPS